MRDYPYYDMDEAARETLQFTPHKTEIYGWDIVVTVILEGKPHVFRYIDRKEGNDDAIPNIECSVEKKAQELFPGCVVLSHDMEWHCYEADLSGAEVIE